MEKMYNRRTRSVSVKCDTECQLAECVQVVQSAYFPVCIGVYGSGDSDRSSISTV